MLCVVIIIATLSASQAAETILGPTQMRCSEVTAGPTEKTMAVVMWVVGYVSGVNTPYRGDFLKGRDTEGIITRFRDVCLDSPEKTVLMAARDVIVRLRLETVRAAAKFKLRQERLY